ncbi:MAG: hypothetical protein NTW86_15555 [Candidatus Sumerlaeota bacterium]|nr:hypothetical protein [Candidatus Sumerlaeota bacterium]
MYPLVTDRVRFLAVDFDNEDPSTPLAFAALAKRYGIESYIERSKSKGYHAWVFFQGSGIPAVKARLVARHILEEVECPDAEIFPKQDALNGKTPYGNFINAPLFGRLVLEGRTVFVNPTTLLVPYPDQWGVLEGVIRVPERLLDELIELNELGHHEPPSPSIAVEPNTVRGATSFGLPPCAQRMLREGVRSNQRVSCFRLAVQLKRVGLPPDIAVAALQVWAARNRPENGKGIITAQEILIQTSSAYAKGYCARGCEDPAMTRYCDASCPVRQKRQAAATPAAAPPAVTTNDDHPEGANS